MIILSGLLIIFLAAVPQLGNAGFEMASMPPDTAIPNWPLVSAQDAQILSNQFGDLGMPQEGQSWLTFSGLGSSNATKPMSPNGFTNPPINAVSVGQTFTLEGSQTRLELDVVFLSNETPGSIWEDFLSVDLSDGNQSLNLVVLDINSPMPQTSSAYNQTISGSGMKATSVRHRAVDVPAHFPQATSSTVFTLTLSVGNAVDSSLSSRGYFDNIEFKPGTPIPTAVMPASVRIDPMANGDWLFVAEAPSWPGGTIRTLFSGQVSQPLGSGFFGGLVPDNATYYTLGVSIGVPPFHVLLDGQGRYQFVIPAAAVSNVTADLLCVVFSGGSFVEITPAIRHSF
ncbi:MAG: hypothetical protein ACI97A_002582 [Planctomycetota bacterium]|jgi:hypothetical protein